MKTTNEIRRKVMVLAWDLYRTAKRGTDPRSFANALAGAWAYTKRMAAQRAPSWARGNGARTVYFSSLIASPIARATAGQRYGRRADFQAAHLTARVGY